MPGLDRKRNFGSIKSVTSPCWLSSMPDTSFYDKLTKEKTEDDEDAVQEGSPHQAITLASASTDDFNMLMLNDSGSTQGHRGENIQKLVDSLGI